MIKKYTSTSVTASDISSKALKVAKKNSKRLNVKVNFIKSNLFEKINDRFDCIISNPPYIKTNDIIYLEEEVKKNIILDLSAVSTTWFSVFVD